MYISSFLLLLHSSSFLLIPLTAGPSVPLFLPPAPFIPSQRPLHFFMFLRNALCLHCLLIVHVCTSACLTCKCNQARVCAVLYKLNMSEHVLEDKEKEWVSLKPSEWQHLYSDSVHGGKKLQYIFFFYKSEHVYWCLVPYCLCVLIRWGLTDMAELIWFPWVFNRAKQTVCNDL